MFDIVFIYPADGLRFFQSMVPLGILSVATVARDAGYSVRVIDLNHYRGNLRHDLRLWQPKIIAIGGTTPSRMKSFRAARITKQALPGTTIVYGGVNASFTGREVLERFPEFDFAIGGEGELSFRTLCDILLRQDQQSFDQIPGLAWRTQDGIRMNRIRRIDDLSVLPFPDRSLLDGDYQLDMDFIRGRAEPIITSRGCPAICNFCSASRMFPGGVRVRPMEQVEEEVKFLLSRNSFQGLKVFDSTFTANRQHVERFCRMIKPYNLLWECEIRADTVDYELLSTMKDAGCYYVNMGLESSDPDRLKKIAKGITTEQALAVMADCRTLGIKVKVFFTFGHPGQTWAECMDEVRFIRKHRKQIDFYAVSPVLKIYPGTRLEQEARQLGVIKPRFNWTGRRFDLRNILLLESPVSVLLFQKHLGPVRLLLIAGILFFSGLYSTREFMGRILVENIRRVRRG